MNLKKTTVKKRPVNLNFFTIHFPITAWVSIGHRLSGFFLFLMIPALLWVLQESLASEQRWQDLARVLQHPVLYWSLWLFVAALIYHLIAGIRHLLMDIHIGESKAGGKIGAWLVMGASLLLLAAIGYVVIYRYGYSI